MKCKPGTDNIHLQRKSQPALDFLNILRFQFVTQFFKFPCSSAFRDRSAFCMKSLGQLWATKGTWSFWCSTNFVTDFTQRQPKSLRVVSGGFWAVRRPEVLHLCQLIRLKGSGQTYLLYTYAYTAISWKCAKWGYTGTMIIMLGYSGWKSGVSGWRDKISIQMPCAKWMNKSVTYLFSPEVLCCSYKNPPMSETPKS